MKKLVVLIIIVAALYSGWQEIEKEKAQKKANFENIMQSLRNNMQQNSSSSSVMSQPIQSTPTQQMVNVVCPMCHGSGTYTSMPGDVFAPVVTCPNCNGRKVVSVAASEVMQGSSQPSYNQMPQQSNKEPLACPSCYGSGKCSGCAGRGEKNYSDLYGSHRYECSICKGTGLCNGCHGSGHI